jgi:hypothetical protein
LRFFSDRKKTILYSLFSIKCCFNKRFLNLKQNRLYDDSSSKETS